MNSERQELKPWQLKLLHGVLWVTVFPAMFIGALVVLGMMVEGYGKYRAEKDRCLKHATNGYEIKQCR